MKKDGNKLNPHEIKYPAAIHYVPDEDDPDDGYYVAYLPDFGFSACSAVGDTPEEAISNLHEVKTFVIESFLEENEPLPEISPNPGDVNELQQMLIRVPKDIHSKLKNMCKKNSQSMNAYVNGIFTEHLTIRTMEDRIDSYLDNKWKAYIGTFSTGTKPEAGDNLEFVFSSGGIIQSARPIIESPGNKIVHWKPRENVS